MPDLHRRLHSFALLASTRARGVLAIGLIALLGPLACSEDAQGDALEETPLCAPGPPSCPTGSTASAQACGPQEARCEAIAQCGASVYCRAPQTEATPQSGSPGQAGGNGGVETSPTNPQGPTAPHPRAPQRWPEPQGPALTHDVGRNLDDVLEREALQGACQRWEAGFRDELTKLRCGKWMFFYETFGTVGIPAPLVDFLLNNYEDFYGAGFARMGMVPLPGDPRKLPIGLAATTGKVGTLDTLAFTCASCHFGQMADGRYAVGYANMELEYGLWMATMPAVVSLSMPRGENSVHPSVRERVGPAVEAAKARPGYMIELGVLGMQLLGADPNSSPSVDQQGQFMTLDPGTMDFLTAPIADDGVWTVSRILSLWNLPDAEQRQALSMPHERLSWNGGGHSLGDFLEGFVRIGLGEWEAWPRERFVPLEAYIRSLRTPPQERPVDRARAYAGSHLFVDQGCVECHDGTSGESSKVYSLEEMGTDTAMANIFNPSGQDLCCDFPRGGYDVTRGVKAPRMTGIENQQAFLHNGAVRSLEELFCLAPRRTNTPPAQGALGHRQTCEGLSDAQKQDLMAYLRSL